MTGLNFPNYPTTIFVIWSLIGSWGISAFIEGTIWYLIIKRQMGYTKYFQVLGWMSLLQTISTVLSYGITLMFFGLLLWISPLPSYFDIIFASSFVYNPLGVFFGFFLVPVLFEFWLWQGGLRWLQQSLGQPENMLEAIMKWQILGSGTVIANACTFLLGILVGSPFIVWGLIGSGPYFVLFMVIVFLWFVVSTFQEEAPPLLPTRTYISKRGALS